MFDIGITAPLITTTAGALLAAVNAGGAFGMESGVSIALIAVVVGVVWKVSGKIASMSRDLEHLTRDLGEAKARIKELEP